MPLPRYWSYAAILSLLFSAVSRCQSVHFAPPMWRTIGPTRIPNAHACDNAAESALPAAGKLQAFAINLSNPAVMYAGGGAGPGDSGPYSNGGLYKSTDGGGHWSPIVNGLTDRYVDALWLDQTQPETILASTWFDGIFRSTDGGFSWTNVRASSSTAFAQRGKTLLVGAADGIITSSDSGASWSMLQTTASPVRTLRCNVTACYAGLQDGTVLAQGTQNSSWRTVLPGFSGSTAWDIAVSPAGSSPVMVVRNNSGKLENLISRDAGATWTPLAIPAPQPALNCSGSGPTQVIAFDTVDPNLVYSGFGGSVWVSHDGTASWTPVNLFEDLRLFYPLPGQTGKVVAGGDQGLYFSQDSGATWSSLNGDLSNALLTHVAVSGTEIMTAVQDFSPILSFDGGASWLQLSGPRPPAGEDGVVAINPGNPQYRYSFNTAGFWYSSDGGKTFLNDNANLNYTEFGFNGTTDYIAFAPDNPEHLYIVGSVVYESLDYGVHWRPTGWPIESPTFVVFDPGNAKAVFVGSWISASATGAVMFSHDGGATWNRSVLPFAGRRPVSLAVDPRDSTTIFLGISEPASVPGAGVLLSTDGGRTFVSNTQGLVTHSALSGYYAGSVRFAPPTLPHIAVVATSSGLYIAKAGDPWTNISGNAIPYQFSGIAWAGDTLYASTYGQGVLMAPVTAILPITLTPSAVAMDAGGGAGAVSVSSATWGALSEASWITVTSGSLGAGFGAVQYTVAPNSSQSSRTGTILIGGARFTVSQAGVHPPVASIAGVTNAASYAKDANGAGSAIAPGSLVSIFGTFPGATTETAASLPLPTSLGNARVTFNGIPAPLTAVVAEGAFPLINAQAPFGIAPPAGGTGTADVVVTVNGASSAPHAIPTVSASAGVFTIPPTGQGNAILIFVDPADNAVKIAAPTSAVASIGYPTAPIPIGGAGFFYATGLGALLPSQVDGTDDLKPHSAAATPSVLVGGVNAQVLFAGQAPGFPGVNQINIVIPDGAPSGDAVPLQIKTMDGEVLSTPGATIAIRPAAN